jgi:hypothetical protein
MRNISNRSRARAIQINISPVRALTFMVGLLMVSYMALMAFTMSYAVIHTEYAQQSRNAEAQVGVLETQYFNALAQINKANPVALGYVQPVSQHFAALPAAPAVAIAQ